MKIKDFLKEEDKDDNTILKILNNENVAKEEDVDPQELAWGIEIEAEHSSDPEVRKRIALAHLYEFDKYYTALRKMEKSLKKD